MRFPHREPIDVTQLLDLDDALTLGADELIELLDDQLSERRKQRIDDVVAERTVEVIPVMDGIYDLGNAAAVLRSAEGMGYQRAHVIDTQPHHKASDRITQGADKWMDVERWTDPAPCIDELQKEGYRIVATDLEADMELADVDFTRPTALVFGNEKDGCSDEMLQRADARCIIPIRGFVQSFNISVAAAMSLYQAMRQRIDKQGYHGDLDDEQRRILKAHFYIRATNDARRLVPSLWRRRCQS